MSVSWPEVARLLLVKKEPVRFLTYESNKKEEYDDFDPFLYSKLVDARKVMIDILQDRDKKLDLRVGLVLAIAHDLQVRIKREDIFSIDDVFEKYQTEKISSLLIRTCKSCAIASTRPTRRSSLLLLS